MNRIIEARGTGKTSKLMNMAKENNAIFVCGNPAAMYDKALAYGITGLQIVSYEDILESMAYDGRDIVIDELELFVKYTLFNVKLQGYTLTTED